MNDTLSDYDIERLARRRASAKMGWYLHAGIYLAVNLALAVLSAQGGRSWAVFPAFGWGIALAAHGIAVFVLSGAGGLHDRLIQRELERLHVRRDPW